MKKFRTLKQIEADAVATYLANKKERCSMLRTFLMMPIEELVCRLVKEKEAKERAWQILKEENIAYKL